MTGTSEETAPGDSVRRRKRILGLLLGVMVLAMTVGVVAAAEWVIRSKGEYRTYLERNGGRYVPVYQGRKTWFFVRPTNYSTVYERPEFDYELTTNSEGLRDVEHPVSKDSGEFRILTVGDSFTEGQGAQMHETWPRRLETLLNEKSHGATFRVINAGVAGNDPIYGFKLLEQRLLRYQLDLVIVAMNTSDIDDVVSRGGMDRFQEDGTVAPPRRPRIEWLFRRSHLFRLIAMEYLGYNWLLLRHDEVERLRREALDHLFDIAQRYAGLGRDHGFDLLVVFHPALWELKRGTTNYAPLIPRLEGSEISVLDLCEYFSRELPADRFGELYWPIDRHHNAVGYRLFAQGVELALRDSRLLPL